MTQHFVDQAGRYLGGYDGPPEGLPAHLRGTIEVPVAPQSAHQTWDGTAWSAFEAPAATPTPDERLRALEEALEDKAVLSRAERQSKLDEIRQRPR